MLSTKWRYCSLRCKMDALAMVCNSSGELSCAALDPSMPTLAAIHADAAETQPKAGGLQGQAVAATAGGGRDAHKHAALYGPALPPAAAAAVAAHTARQVTLGLAAVELDWEVEEAEEPAACATPPRVLRRPAGRAGPPPQTPLYTQAKARRLALAEPCCIKKMAPTWAMQHPGGLPHKVHQELAKLIRGLDSAGLGAAGKPAEASALKRRRKLQSPSCSPAI
jgi:hypothetical protein